MLFLKIIKILMKGKEWFLIIDQEIIGGTPYKVIQLIRLSEIAVPLKILE